MNQLKKMATMALAASLCLAMLAGCGNKKADEDDSGLDEVVVEQQKQAEDEHAAYMQEVKKTDVLANIGDLQKMSNVVEAFYDVDTESLTDMQAWEHIPSAEETIEGSEYAYIFIAKLNADADASAICSQLLSSGSELKGMDSDDMEINVAASGGYVIFAGAPNGADIQAKFTIATGREEADSSASLLKLLSEDLSK